MKVRYAAEAKADLVEIGAWIAYDNPERATSFVNELRAVCERIGEMPRAFSVLPRFKRRQIRRKPYQDYSIFYRIGRGGVEILHVIHSARNFEVILSAAALPQR